MNARRTIPLTLCAISVAGMAISIYLTFVHYAHVPLVCSTTGVVNCERVLSSPYSNVGSIPISVGGLVWFAVAGALALSILAQRAEPGWLQPAQVLWSLLGLLTVIYLVGVEALALGVICVWCTVLHVLILLTLVLSIVRTPGEGADAHTEQASRKDRMPRERAAPGR
jgi:uncharacterized membrane protein